MQPASRFEQSRIAQLLGLYAPHEPPRLPLDFGDYLSLMWRYDRCADRPRRAAYYRQCLTALASGLRIHQLAIQKLVETTPPGELFRQLPNLPYRDSRRLVDAQDRKAAINQLCHLRDSICEIGAYQQNWGVSYPGAGIQETELRERVFAVLFTALQGQFQNFARMLLVTDIVLANLLVGYDVVNDAPLDELILLHGYPDPEAERTRRDYDGDEAGSSRR
jgi:hypothetical protein